ncbi:hypothetical protein ACFY9F_35985 [Streptomyces sp. NPDC012421]|uniref:hypothetical protein n=1 Tax=Streptomyces sp. NPDC012421 TaxID=3364832 RepID=UPI0036E02CE8
MSTSALTLVLLVGFVGLLGTGGISYVAYRYPRLRPALTAGLMFATVYAAVFVALADR